MHACFGFAEAFDAGEVGKKAEGHHLQGLGVQIAEEKPVGPDFVEVLVEFTNFQDGGKRPKIHLLPHCAKSTTLRACPYHPPNHAYDAPATGCPHVVCKCALANVVWRWQKQCAQSRCGKVVFSHTRIVSHPDFRLTKSTKISLMPSHSRQTPETE